MKLKNKGLLAAVIIVVVVLAGFFFSRYLPGFRPALSELGVESDIADPQIKEEVIGYLENNFSGAGFGGEVFCSIGWVKTVESRDALKIYLARLCQEYYLGVGGKLEEGTGASGPVALALQKEDGGYTVVGHQVPRDGSLYEHDFLEIFPKEYKTMLNGDFYAQTRLVEDMSRNNMARAEDYAKAVAAVQAKHPDLKDYPSESLPPRSIDAENDAEGWYVAFVQNGSGRPIISARCFKVAGDGAVAVAGNYQPGRNASTPEPLAVSPKTCEGIAYPPQL